MVVVTAGRAADHVPGDAAVAAAVHGDVRHVHDVGVLRIDRDLLEIPAASPERLVGADAPPRAAGVVGPEHTALSGWRLGGWGGAPGCRRRWCWRVGIGHQAVHHGVHAPWVGRRDGDAGSSNPSWRQTSRQLVPSRSAVGRLVDAPTGAVGGCVREPRWAAGIPEAGIHHARVRRIDDDLDRADVLVLVEDFLPGAAAVARAEQSPLGICGIELTDRRDEDHIGILRMHGDLADVVRIDEPEVGPGAAGVGRFVDAVAEACRVAERGFPGAHEDHVGRRWRDRQSADRGYGLVVKYREPRSAGVPGFPNAAVDVPEIEFIGPVGHAAHGGDAAAAERAEHAPVQTDRDVEETGGALGWRGRVEEGRPLEPKCRQRDAGLSEADEEIAARGHA